MIAMVCVFVGLEVGSKSPRTLGSLTQSGRDEAEWDWILPLLLLAQLVLYFPDHDPRIALKLMDDALASNQALAPILNQTTGNIIDFPASYHNGAAGLSFADGHSEIHQWKGSKIKAPVKYNNSLALNVPAGDSLNDVKWWSKMTTVPASGDSL